VTHLLPTYLSHKSPAMNTLEQSGTSTAAAHLPASALAPAASFACSSGTASPAATSLADCDCGSSGCVRLLSFAAAAAAAVRLSSAMMNLQMGEQYKQDRTHNRQRWKACEVRGDVAWTRVWGYDTKLSCPANRHVLQTDKQMRWQGSKHTVSEAVPLDVETGQRTAGPLNVCICCDRCTMGQRMVTSDAADYDAHAACCSMVWGAPAFTP
jgi:hypothetical protein